SHAGRPGADDGHPLAGLVVRRTRPDLTEFVGLVRNRLLDRLDRDRNVFQVERASFLAWRWADPAGPFRKIVGGVEVADRAVPVVAIDEIVPVRDLVVHRAAGGTVTEGNAAVHASGGLLFHFP